MQRRSFSFAKRCVDTGNGRFQLPLDLQEIWLKPGVRELIIFSPFLPITSLARRPKKHNGRNPLRLSPTENPMFVGVAQIWVYSIFDLVCNNSTRMCAICVFFSVFTGPAGWAGSSCDFCTVSSNESCPRAQWIVPFPRLEAFRQSCLGHLVAWPLQYCRIFRVGKFAPVSCHLCWLKKNRCWLKRGLKRLLYWIPWLLKSTGATPNETWSYCTKAAGTPPLGWICGTLERTGDNHWLALLSSLRSPPYYDLDPTIILFLYVQMKPPLRKPVFIYLLKTYELRDIS